VVVRSFVQPRRSAFNAATSFFLLVMVTPFSVRLIIPGVAAAVGGGHPDFDTDAASIERSVGTKHPSYVGRDGIGTPNLAAR